jgi:dihydroorotate dehydrogenase (fumarate)
MRTSYLGLKLDHPFIAGASPLGFQLDTIKRLEDAGCAAIVLPSLFEEQITATYSGHIGHISLSGPDFTEVIAAFPASGDYLLGPDDYAAHVYRVKRAVGIPLVGSLNGRTGESWLKFARIIEEAGADALELNVYDVHADLSTCAAAVEDKLAQLVRDVKGLLKIPVAVKLSPFFTAFANVAQQLDAAGADGLVLFNRFYQPDIDLRTLTVSPRVELSTSAELVLRLRWLAILHGRIRPSLAVSGGVATPADGIKALLAGADAVQMVSALLRHGPAYVGAMRQGLQQWLESRQMGSVEEARGAVSLKRTGDAQSYERAHYIRTLHSWTAPPSTTNATAS